MTVIKKDYSNHPLVILVVGFRKKWRQQGISEEEIHQKTLDCYFLAKMIQEDKRKEKERLKQGNKVLKFGEFCKEWKQDKQYVPYRPEPNNRIVITQQDIQEAFPYALVRVIKQGQIDNLISRLAA